MTLHSILGLNRIAKKKTKPKPLSQPQKWPSSLLRTKPTPQPEPPKQSLSPPKPSVTLTQAHTHSLTTMFSPLPSLPSSQSPTILTFRSALPPIISTPHLHSLLATPTIAEREITRQIHAGVIRRVIVPRRGEFIIRSSDLETMIRSTSSTSLDEQTREGLITWLRTNPAAQRVDGLANVDALVRAGFLTVDCGEGLERPGERYKTMGLEVVARQPTGSVGAVGGRGVVREAGTGVKSLEVGDDGRLRVAVPGMGTWLKVVEGAVGYLVELVERSGGMVVEGTLKERWEGVEAARGRGEWKGVLPGRTKKWREFYGLAFEWVLEEAAGLGRIELFETRSVGRGVRLIG